MKTFSDVFKKQKILVLGDFMLDAYTMGRAHRLSPEAPVPLLTVEKETYLPGGGGNAILNLLSLGMDVMAVGRVGDDMWGRRFLEMISEPKVDTLGIFIDESFQTPLKKRLIADQQQLLRVDYEKVEFLSEEKEKKVMNYVASVIKQASVVAISDYAKGFFTPSLLQNVITLAREHAIPIVIDPKGSDFTKYKGATLIKPNFNEAVTASGLSKATPLREIACKLLEKTHAEVLLITRAKEGLSLFMQNGEECYFPAQVKQVTDVTGAGDTVMAVVTALVGNRADLKAHAHFANIAAGIALEKLGCARVSIEEILQKL